MWRHHRRSKRLTACKNLRRLTKVKLARRTWVLSLEWKAEGVKDGESEGGDCQSWGDMCRMRWTRRRVNRMRLKKGDDSTGNVMHIWNRGWWFVMRKIRMVELGWQQMRSGFHLKTEPLIRLCRQSGWLCVRTRWVRGVYVQCVRSLASVD